MMKNKVFRVCLITGILIFIMALSCFASATYDEGVYSPANYDIVVYTSYANTEWLGMVETTILNNGVLKSICFFSVNMNVLQYLQNSDFVNGNQTATAYLDFWNIGSILPMSQNDIFITNIDDISFQLVAIGEYVKQGNSIADLNNQITNLNNQITNLNNQITILNDEISSNEETIDRLQSDLTSQRELTQYWQDLYNSENESKENLQNNYDNLLRNYNSLNNAYDELSVENDTLENRINELQNIIDRGTYSEGFDNGYNQALKDYEIFKSGFVTVLSSPMYVLNTIFGFELFGFNFFTVIQFILSVFLVVWLFKKMR